MRKMFKAEGSKKNGHLAWVAYCVDCGRELDRANDGQYIEFFCKDHTEKTGHKTLCSMEFTPGKKRVQTELTREVEEALLASMMVEVKRAENFMKQAHRSLNCACDTTLAFMAEGYREHSRQAAQKAEEAAERAGLTSDILVHGQHFVSACQGVWERANRYAMDAKYLKPANC